MANEKLNIKYEAQKIKPGLTDKLKTIKKAVNSE